jgi:hypothetical protein
MVARLPSPYRRLIVVLGSALGLVAGAVPARADMLFPQFAPNSPGHGLGYRQGQGSPIVYRSDRRNGEAAEEGEGLLAGDSSTAVQVLAMILVMPAGTEAMSSSSSQTNLSSVTKAAATTSNASNAGGGQQSSSANDPGVVTAPEPASVGLAVLGTALTGLAQLRLRRRRQ